MFKIALANLKARSEASRLLKKKFFQKVFLKAASILAFRFASAILVNLMLVII